ncbi:MULTISPECIES: ABC transporter permease subunit [Saccharopolyspora]|uniref:Peptide/nickel transport system permease protein n=1 Tax=Saccharopolyspora flava TaxID=95161 RepID=A0A1I6UTK0_9PSEU|nr:ABC transporter permease subunit [Saccharopolyspora flava]SFT04761.1 peptide/nickel transport system permease protein [Saccharopolyspora flava]
MTTTNLLRAVTGWLLLGIPLCLALLGPVFAGTTRSEAGPLLSPDSAHLLGTDALGRDVLALVLSGGRTVVVLTGAALALAYLAGVPLALVMVGQARQWIDQALLHGLDVLLALPGLLVLLVLAATGRQSAASLVVAVAVLQLPAIVRLARSAALAPGCRTVVETMVLQGEPWWRIHLWHTGRAVLGPVAVDAGSRLILVLQLMASANFLGLGLPASASDWAVLVERNREALFLQPLAVVAPALLLVALCTGANLVVDRTAAKRSEVAA